MTADKNDRFTSPPPKFIAPKGNHLEAPKIDHTPAKPIAQQLEVGGEEFAAELLKQSKIQGVEYAKYLANIQAPASIKKKAKVKSIKSLQPKYIDAHVLSDEDFIIYTRDMTIHSKGAVALFFANGGENFYCGNEMTLQQSFDMLRRHKQSLIKAKCTVK